MEIIKKLPFVEQGNSSPAQVWSNLNFWQIKHETK